LSFSFFERTRGRTNEERKKNSPSHLNQKNKNLRSLLKKTDYICSTYRDHVHALSKNVPAREIMAELFGKKTGICRGQGG
jgi:TPP-dependent pyruvate/acetoin dehydrogenase alpha subunit